jgi:hypothetical protein
MLKQNASYTHSITLKSHRQISSKCWSQATSLQMQQTSRIHAKRASAGRKIMLRHGLLVLSNFSSFSRQPIGYIDQPLVVKHKQCAALSSLLPAQVHFHACRVRGIRRPATWLDSTWAISRARSYKFLWAGSIIRLFDEGRSNSGLTCQ